jgi:hypothetical protein
VVKREERVKLSWQIEGRGLKCLLKMGRGLNCRAGRGERVKLPWLKGGRGLNSRGGNGCVSYFVVERRERVNCRIFSAEINNSFIFCVGRPILCDHIIKS